MGKEEMLQSKALVSKSVVWQYRRCITDRCSSGRLICTRRHGPDRTKGGDVVVLEWRCLEKASDMTGQPFQRARDDVSQPLCGAGPGGIAAGHWQWVGVLPTQQRMHRCFPPLWYRRHIKTFVCVRAWWGNEREILMYFFLSLFTVYKERKEKKKEKTVA